MCFIVDNIIEGITAAIVAAEAAAPVIGGVGLGLDAASLIACAAGDSSLAGILGSVGGVFGAVSGVGGALNAIQEGTDALYAGATAAAGDAAEEGASTTFGAIYHGYQIASGLGQLGVMVSGNADAAKYFGAVNGLLGGGFGLGEATTGTEAIGAGLQLWSSATTDGLMASGHDKEAEYLGLGSGILESGLATPDSIEKLEALDAQWSANAQVQVDESNQTSTIAPSAREAFFGPGVVSDETKAMMDNIAGNFNADEDAVRIPLEESLQDDPDNPPTGTELAPTPQVARALGDPDTVSLTISTTEHADPSGRVLEHLDAGDPSGLIPISDGAANINRGQDNDAQANLRTNAGLVAAGTQKPVPPPYPGWEELILPRSSGRSNYAAICFNFSFNSNSIGLT